MGGSGRWWGRRSWVPGCPPTQGPHSRRFPAGVLPALATRGGPSSTHGPGSGDRRAVGAVCRTTRLPIGKRGPLPLPRDQIVQRRRKEAGSAPGAWGFLGEAAPLAAAPVGTRGARAVGARTARGEVPISWTQQPRRSRHGPLPLHEEVPLPTSPRRWGADPPCFLGLELRFWVNNGRCTNRY